MARPKKAVEAKAVPERSTVTEPSVKKRRTPVGQRQILSVKGKDPNYIYRFVNDVGDRIPQFLDGGYEFVDKEDHRIGDNRVNNATPEGSRAQASVGGGVKAYLMRIHKDYYVEDQKVKQDRVDELERSILNTAAADYGKVTIDKSGSKGD